MVSVSTATALVNKWEPSASSRQNPEEKEVESEWRRRLALHDAGSLISDERATWHEFEKKDDLQEPVEEARKTKEELNEDIEEWTSIYEEEELINASPLLPA